MVMEMRENAEWLKENAPRLRAEFVAKCEHRWVTEVAILAATGGPLAGRVVAEPDVTYYSTDGDQWGVYVPLALVFCARCSRRATEVDVSTGTEYGALTSDSE